jgi:hypothetical protein
MGEWSYSSIFPNIEGKVPPPLRIECRLEIKLQNDFQIKAM